MPISGAIFDFDGTLVDSMPAWHDVTVCMLERYGVPNAEEFFVETESLPLRELCEVLHDRHVPSASTDDLEAEIKADMREAYLSDIDLLDGCLDFLDDLRAHGVPMVVASSTPASELEVILRAKNIRGYFQDVLSTGGEIRSKDYPDIWHVARERLGTPASETWVFEDAPFSLRSATGAGFRTACLFSPHGDRTPQEVAPFSTFLVHGYPELSFALLDDYADASDATAPEAGASDAADAAADVSAAEKSRILVVGGSPQRSAPELVATLAAEADYVIAVDAGAAPLRDAGVTPDVFCGDCDSVADADAAWAREAATRTISLPSEKYATDLAYAIGCARHEAARRHAPAELTLTCVSGGRPDHALGVLGLLASNADLACRVVEDDFELRVLSPGGRDSWHLEGLEGATFSVVSLAEKSVVSERGSVWELDHAELAALADEGVSNRVASADACVTCHEGCVAVYVLR